MLGIGQDNTDRGLHHQSYPGPVVAVVTSLDDPEELGRVKVKFPWLDDSVESCWARIVAPFAGEERGIYFLPEVDDEVLVMFQFGNFQSPLIMGSMWNGKDLPPSKGDSGENNLKIIQTRAKHRIEFNDKEGEEYILISDGEEKNTIRLDMKNEVITIETSGDLELKSTGDMSLSGKNISIEASSNIDMTASGSVNVEAKSNMKLKGMTINLN